jgi:isopenicillin N synthase-like dioxygenase
VDIGPLVRGADGVSIAESIAESIGNAIGKACRVHGFFYIVGHGVDTELFDRLHDFSRAFFSLPLDDKMRIRMALAGRAWRGFFPEGAELTKGRPDPKEGLYFGAELAPEHPAVVAGRPMHGANLFPDEASIPSSVAFARPSSSTWRR